MFWYGAIVGLIVGVVVTTVLFVYVINKKRVKP
jgi:hypothetical protein